MKKLFLFLLILPFVFVSCGSDDDDVDYSADIVGTWDFSEVLSMGFETNNKEVNKAIKEAYKNVDWSQVDFGEEIYGYVKYMDNGTYESDGDGYPEKGTYRLDGKVLLHTPEGKPTEKYTISIRNNVMQQSADLSGEALQNLVNTVAENNPDFKSLIEEMESYGVKITRTTMSVEFRKR